MLQSGQRIRIGKTSDTFDSRHSLRIGGEYPGEVEYLCTWEPDLQQETYANFGTSEVAVHFVVESFLASEVGDFVLEWKVSPLEEGGIISDRCPAALATKHLHLFRWGLT
jgi:hypothetical protein